ncbi:twin-arginine translocation signal domain-containing protein [Halobacterium sp. KA-6]|uniref:twin-arginine translocation signal domain-containing protein n=1 Tax=Halobacterium sp. KA-6 TaxID=2896368 RepID=UPI001E2F46FB|nr:twin-arginine translocation signal domain-containing protein [Halobacterium sp. KA-6]MCD2204505.1 twin-arginine translocation signal domain-containing protein [Halobacterium sp. KA-6]
MNRRQFLRSAVGGGIALLAGCSSSQQRTDATVFLANLSESQQEVVVRIFDANDSKVWEQQAELPAAPPNEAPSVNTVNALQSVEIDSKFRIEVDVESIEKTATRYITIDCKDSEFVRIRIMKRYEGGKPVVDFREPSC